jgi:hypothetical protein
VTAFLSLSEYPTIGNLVLQQQKTSPKPENGHQKNEKNTQKNKNTTRHNDRSRAGSGLHRNRSGFHHHHHHHPMLKPPTIQRGYRALHYEFHDERACFGQCAMTETSRHDFPFFCFQQLHIIIILRASSELSD